MRNCRFHPRYLARPLVLAVALISGAALPAVAQIPDVVDVVTACGGFRMALVTDAQLSVDEVGAVADALRDRLGVRGGFMREALDAVRTDEDGRIEVWRAGASDLGQPLMDFLASGPPVSVFAVRAPDSPEASDPDALVVYNPMAPDRSYALDPEPLIAHLRVAGAEYAIDYTDRPSVSVALAGDSRQAFGQVTADNIGKPIAVMLGDRLLTAPTVQQAIWGGTVLITGDFTIEEAETLASEMAASSIGHVLRVEETEIIPAGGGLDAICGALAAQ